MCRALQRYFRTSLNHFKSALVVKSFESDRPAFIGTYPVYWSVDLIGNRPTEWSNCSRINLSGRSREYVKLDQLAFGKICASQ